MKLRTQFILTLLFFGLILSGMVGSLILTNQQVDRVLQQEEIARRIEQGASELNYLSGDYLMYGESQQRNRWESSFTSFSADLASLKPANLEQQAIINHIVADQKRLRAIFTDVVSTIKESAQTSGVATDPAFIRVSWSRMEVQNQSIAFEAAMLSQQLRDEADRLKRMNIMLMFFLFGIFGAYLLTNHYLINQRTLRSIAELQSGTTIIGSGNLDFGIAVRRADEIGELAHAFNLMAANLKEVTASKTDLEREIAEREQAEAKLERSNQKLNEIIVSIQDDFYVLDRDWNFVYASRLFTSKAGKEPEDFVGNNIWKMFPNHVGTVLEENFSAAMEKREIRRFEIGGNHTAAWYRMTAFPSAEGITVLGTDITESRRAEEALQEGTARLQAQAVEMEMQAEELRAQKNELVVANEHLRLSEELANQRLMETQAAIKELQSARLAALNLMEDALAAQEKVKQINARLRESEQRLNRAQEIAHLGSWELDLVNDRLTWSDEVYRIFGLQAQEFSATYEAFLEFVHPDDRAAVNDAYAGSIREGKDSYEIEHRIVKHSSGEVRVVHEKCEHFRDDAGQIVRSVGMVHDITGRRQAEEALRESEQKFRSAFANAAIGFAMTAPNGHFVDANPAYCALTGYGLDELLTMEFPSLLYPDDRAENMKLINRMLTGQITDFVVENRYLRKDKREVWVRKSVSIVRDIQGLPQWIIALVEDITERKQAEESLGRAHDELEERVRERTRELSNEINERKGVERQLRIRSTAMGAAANGIVITDPQGTIEWTNPALAHISGYEAHELIGQNMRIFKSGQHAGNYYSNMWETILLGEVWRGETVNCRKDGTLYTEEQTITPVRGDQGQITHFIAIKQDITERKQAEEKLEQQNAELQIISTAERNQRQFSEALIKAALVLNRSLKLDDVLPLILEQIRDVIPYQLADVTLLEGETFYDASHQGDFGWPANLMDVNNRFLVESFPLFNKMRETGEPVLVLDTRKEQDWITIDSLVWVRSFLSVPLLVENKVIGFVNLFSDQPGFFTQQMSDRLVAFAAHASIAIQNAWLFEQVQASTERLQSLSRRLVEIQENERKYISRELHDEAGQVLTSLLVDLRLLEKNASQPDSILKIVAEMERSLNGVIENLHRMAMALRPASLDHVGLVAALRQHVETVGEKHGIQASFRSSGVIERLPANVETILYRTVQEALTNVVRHAQATRVDVVLMVRDQKLVVLVEDDGVGFDPGAVPTDGHLGLFGIRERSEMIGATLMVESEPGKGTTIMMEVAYANTVTGRR